jgi:hypothetical protein
MELPCSHLLKREWWAYPLDVLTMGGYRLHKTLEYSVCLSNTKREDYERLMTGLNKGIVGRKV